MPFAEKTTVNNWNSAQFLPQTYLKQIGFFYTKKEEAWNHNKVAYLNLATATLMNFLRGMIGPGCLSLPLAFRQAGLWTAFIMVFVFGLLNNFCMLKIVHCSQYLGTIKGDIRLDYGSVAYEAFAHSFPWLQPHKHKARFFTNAMIIVLQMGDFIRAEHFIDELPSISSFDGIVKGAGSILYAFEGQAIVLPMENGMKYPKDMLGATGVLSTERAIYLYVEGTNWDDEVNEQQRRAKSGSAKTMFRNTRGEERVDPNESVRPNRFQQISKIALKRQNGISATGALLNFVKGMLGPGFLSLPLAFKQAGLWTAFAIVFVFGFLNNFCMLQLVHASQYLCSLIFTNAMLVLLQMGVCCVSYVFIAAHLQQELITAPHVTSELPWITNFNGIISAAGSILYSFEGQAMVLPLENKLKHSEDMVGATGVLTTGMSLVTIVYAASGFFGYITFGETVRGMIVAIAIPNLEQLVPFVGIVSGMILAFVLPAFIDTITFIPIMIEQHASKSKIVFRLIQNSCLALLGIFGLIIGLQSSIRDILSN
ncbi:Putative amino acid permease F59B2.2 [Toxocara canis]|uniref:Putative amino acid permease F59B2.2 n=1 Tax=Toxocara canis TaxID=6265 RepID=A0A0B2W5P0_TOXCA|nr:Putative amino acid permease F59B2.2 [Toxocara canis]